MRIPAICWPVHIQQKWILFSHIWFAIAATPSCTWVQNYSPPNPLRSYTCLTANRLLSKQNIEHTDQQTDSVQPGRPRERKLWHLKKETAALQDLHRQSCFCRC